ncbi:MAG: CYTH domain-containing protein [Actinomycetaceae bacterium]|nr:CYTH domain-containing protein [Actinomycetaceae bacterium]
MAIEIERKFLIVSDGWKKHIARTEELAQGYLAASPRCLVRVRASQDRGWLTVKGGQIGDTDTLTRLEFEYEIPCEHARDMLGAFALSSVAKTRYTLDLPQYQWTVDVFHGANDGLVILEIEGPDVEMLGDKDLPEWVGEDVSADPRMSNAALSHNPYSQWGN